MLDQLMNFTHKKICKLNKSSTNLCLNPIIEKFLIVNVKKLFVTFDKFVNRRKTSKN